MAMYSVKTIKEIYLSPSEKALPDVSNYFGNSAGKFIEFMKLVGMPINARLYSNRTGTWLKTQDEGRIMGMEECVIVPLDPGDPRNAFQFGSKKSKKRTAKRSKKNEETIGETIGETIKKNEETIGELIYSLI
jgi:hypothetical protein